MMTILQLDFLENYYFLNSNSKVDESGILIINIKIILLTQFKFIWQTWIYDLRHDKLSPSTTWTHIHVMGLTSLWYNKPSDIANQF